MTGRLSAIDGKADRPSTIGLAISREALLDKPGAHGLTVSDGRETLGFIVDHDGRSYAFDGEERPLGVFADRKAAAAAVSNAAKAAAVKTGGAP